MIEDGPFWQWLALFVIYGWGFHLGRAIYNTRMKWSARWQMAFTSAAFFLLLGGLRTQNATSTRGIMFWIALGLLLVSFTTPLWRRDRSEELAQ